MNITKDDADTRLAVYGSLAPGRANHRELAGLNGHWRQGSVRGRLVSAGWGAAIGYPGMVLDPAAGPVDVQLFESADLPEHWQRLDAFEGEGYRRISTRVLTADVELSAWIYVVAGTEAGGPDQR